MRELNVVISGFDHYDGVEVNPAVEVPKAIAEQGLGVSSAPEDRKSTRLNSSHFH